MTGSCQETEYWSTAQRRGAGCRVRLGNQPRVKPSAMWQSARLSCSCQPAMMMMAPKPTAMVSETDGETAVVTLVGACICLLLDTLPP